MAKAALWPVSDAEARKRGEQTGLDTLVVHALNDACQMSGALESGIQLKDAGIPITIGIQNPSSTDKKYPESSIWDPQSTGGILNPRLSWIPSHKTTLVLNVLTPQDKISY